MWNTIGKWLAAAGLIAVVAAGTASGVAAMSHKSTIAASELPALSVCGGCTAQDQLLDAVLRQPLDDQLTTQLRQRFGLVVASASLVDDVAIVVVRDRAAAMPVCQAIRAQKAVRVGNDKRLLVATHPRSGDCLTVR